MLYVKNSFTCCGLNPESIPIDITCMKEGRPAESACDLVRKFWHDTSKLSENPSNLCFTYGWGSIRDGVLLFQYSFLTGVLLTFSWGGVVIKSGAQIELIR